ncbi:MAG: hypothetical protein GX133_01340 [Syntrophomonadaceae bacterium]|nr:hypothetical protein [Syntrophomonadaceae bacterium]
MDIGDRVVICESRHPLYNFKGSVVGRRGPKGPDDIWLLVYVDDRGRSFLIPKSMVRIISEEEYRDARAGPFGGKPRYN